MRLSCLFLASALSIGAPKQTFTFAYDTPPTPVCGSTIHTVVGQPVNFTVKVTNTDPNQVVALLFLAGPPGSALSDPNPIVVYGNGVDPIVITNNYSWTPAADQIGDFYVTWDSADLSGTRLLCTVTIHVDAKPPEGCTYTQGGWGARPQGGNPGTILKNGFATAFPSGIEIGVPGASGYSLKFTSAKAVENFLPTGGTPSPLNADATNPVAPTSAGVFAGQVLALTISVGFANAGITPNGPFDSVKLCNLGDALDGKTIADVRGDASNVLGGEALPAAYGSISELNDLVEKLNEAFDNCVTSAWAAEHLCN